MCVVHFWSVLVWCGTFWSVFAWSCVWYILVGLVMFVCMWYILVDFGHVRWFVVHFGHGLWLWSCSFDYILVEFGHDSLYLHFG